MSLLREIITKSKEHTQRWCSGLWLRSVRVRLGPGAPKILCTRYIQMEIQGTSKVTDQCAHQRIEVFNYTLSRS